MHAASARASRTASPDRVVDRRLSFDGRKGLSGELRCPLVGPPKPPVALWRAVFSLRRAVREYSMNVSVQKQGDFWQWHTVGSKTFYNDVYNSVFSTYCNSGTYRLYFQSSMSGFTYNIYGSFYN